MALSLTSIGMPQGDQERTVLDGVPRIGYDVHLCPFPGSLYAVMEYLGDPYDYDYLMGVTGACFRRFFNRDDGGNVDLMYLAPEPYQRASRALGYELRAVARTDRAEMIREIRESIARGRPVLAFGVIGPPECGIIAGYDQGGEVMTGYSYFQEDSHQGYYETADWYGTKPGEGLAGLLIVGDKDPQAIPSQRDLLISSLEWAIDLARAPERPNVKDHTSGLAACEAWAAGLEVDADYPPDDPAVMDTRAMVHGDQCVMLEERHCAAKYLRQMMEVAPEAADDLGAAAALYHEVGNAVGLAWPWPGPDRTLAMKGLADPNARREIARAVRRAAETEAEAVGHLEAALKTLTAAP